MQPYSRPLYTEIFSVETRVRSGRTEIWVVEDPCSTFIEPLHNEHTYLGYFCRNNEIFLVDVEVCSLSCTMKEESTSTRKNVVVSRTWHRTFYGFFEDTWYNSANSNARSAFGGSLRLTGGCNASFNAWNCNCAWIEGWQWIGWYKKANFFGQMWKVRLPEHRKELFRSLSCSDGAVPSYAVWIACINRPSHLILRPLIILDLLIWGFLAQEIICYLSSLCYNKLWAFLSNS